MPVITDDMGLSLQNLPLSSFGDTSMQSTIAAAISASRSGNYTESVEVPSSEHVAEIVGRQGCKIKALRAKTNTYIKTPVREQEPVFVITGKKDDVKSAKDEILSAAKHFTTIRATRRNGSTSQIPSIPGQVTLHVEVPMRVVGLLVGSKGATIKRIQHQTDTHIMTPSRDKEPIFEVTGFPENANRARSLMLEHIYSRTGSASPYNGIETEDPLLQQFAGGDNRSNFLFGVPTQMSPYSNYDPETSPAASTNFWVDNPDTNTLANRRLNAQNNVFDMTSLSNALLDHVAITTASMDRNSDPLSHSMSALTYGQFNRNLEGHFNRNGSLEVGSSSLDTLDSLTSSQGTSAHSSPTTNGPWSFGTK